MQMLLDPTILFFCLGIFSVFLKSNIEIPKPTMKFLSYYLLMAIGFKGGVSLNKVDIDSQIILIILFGLAAAIFSTLWSFPVLKLKLSSPDAAAISASYGSVSAVTFLTAISWLETKELAFGGYMIALMALMEAPAIVIGLLLGKKNQQSKSQPGLISKTIHEALFNGSLFILIGSLIIGAIIPPAKAQEYQVFVYDVFKGFLCFFLLDLGISAAKQVQELRKNILFLSGLALIIPIINAFIGLLIAKSLQMQLSDGYLLMIMLASASYIAVPAALKTSLPEANPSIYLSMSLGLTFPFNILIGLPFYWYLAEKFLI